MACWLDSQDSFLALGVMGCRLAQEQPRWGRGMCVPRHTPALAARHTRGTCAGEGPGLRPRGEGQGLWGEAVVGRGKEVDDVGVLPRGLHLPRHLLHREHGVRAEQVLLGRGRAQSVPTVDGLPFPHCQWSGGWVLALQESQKTPSEEEPQQCVRLLFPVGGGKFGI